MIYSSLEPAEPGGTDVHVVEKDCDPELLDPRLDLCEHSPTGFSWGYSGSGPAQLSLAILAHHGGDEYAMRNYQKFKNEFVSTRSQDDQFFVTSGRIDMVIES